MRKRAAAARAKAVEQEAAEPRPPSGEAAASKREVRDVGTEAKHVRKEPQQAAAAQEKQSADDRTESTPKRAEQTAAGGPTSAAVEDATPVQQKTSEQDDPLFQSRVFEPVQFQASDFVTAFDGLAVARRSHPPAARAGAAAASNAAKTAAVESTAATAPATTKTNGAAKPTQASPNATRTAAVGSAAATAPATSKANGSVNPTQTSSNVTTTAAVGSAATTAPATSTANGAANPTQTSTAASPALPTAAKPAPLVAPSNGTPVVKTSTTPVNTASRSAVPAESTTSVPTHASASTTIKSTPKPSTATGTTAPEPTIAKTPPTVNQASVSSGATIPTTETVVVASEIATSSAVASASQPVSKPASSNPVLPSTTAKVTTAKTDVTMHATSSAPTTSANALPTTMPSTSKAHSERIQPNSTTVLLAKKKHQNGDRGKGEEQRLSKLSAAEDAALSDADGVQFVKVTAPPFEVVHDVPVEAPGLGYCSPEFLSFMRECGGEDMDEEDDDPDEVSRSQLKLLNIVDLTSLSDSEDLDSDSESPSPTPRAGVPGAAGLSNLSTGEVEGAGQPKIAAIPSVAGKGTWFVPTLDSERKRAKPERVVCELCEESGLPSRLIRCPTCTKYYHKKCAKENGDESICWNCELGSMIDDSELDAEHDKHNNEYLSYLRAIRRATSPGDDGGEEEGEEEEEQLKEEGDENQGVESKGTTGEENAIMPKSEGSGEASDPFSEGSTNPGRQRWMEFIGGATADVDASFHEVTKRIAEELRDEETKQIYSRGFVSREEFEAQMTEVEEYYITEEARLQQLEREKALEARKAAEVRRTQAAAEQAAADQTGGSAVASKDQPANSDASTAPPAPASVPTQAATSSVLASNSTPSSTTAAAVSTAPPSSAPKKTPRQSSIASFFSPQKADDKAAQSEPQSAAAPAAKSTGGEANSSAKTEGEQQQEEGAKPQNSAKKAGAKPRAKAAAKPKAKGKAKAKPRKKPARFVSPHAMGNDDDEDDLDGDEDVFNTPEAKRARAELEAGGETVPAGAPISDDAIVNEEDIVDVSAADSPKKVNGGDGEALSGEAAGDGVVDLTATSVDEGAGKTAGENGEDRKGQLKAVKLPAVKNAKAAKTPTKRQQKMKEKAAAAAAAAEAKTAPVEPLDPKTQARVDTYKLKTDELTKQFVELLQSKQESDVVMQEIYGAALDCNLDVAVDQSKTRQSLAETWKKLQNHAKSTSNATEEAAAIPSAIEFPHEVKCLIVKGIQGRTSSLSILSGELLTAFKKELEADDVDMEAESITESAGSFNIADAIDRAASLAMEMEIKMLAQRTPHGIRPAKANVFEDTSTDAMWVWEVGNPEKYFKDEAQKTIKRMRKHRKRLGQQLKTLARVVQLLHQKPVDEAKVSAEEAKVGKFGFIVDAEVQKMKDREAKEQERLLAAEEKKRHDLERKQAKDEEKRKREREEEQKKAKSSKRQKQFVSYFAQHSSNSDPAAANSAGTSASTIDMTGDQEAENVSGASESKSAKINRMDAAFSFLGSNDDGPSETSSRSHQSIFLSLKDKRGATKGESDNCSPDGWTAQRFRDPKLGAMKLLQFYENVRPAYYGTYSSRSRVFRGGRRPLAQYTKFDYSVDSDDEWEEEEPGESLSDADDDGDESDEDNLDYEDQWLAYEDEVDYMDDAPADDDEPMDGGDRPMKHKLPSQLQKKRAKAKSVKPAKLEPQIIGPFLCKPNGSDACMENHFSGFTGELLCAPVFESTLMRKAREYEEEQKRLEALRQEQQRKKEQQQEEEKRKADEKKALDATEKTATPAKHPAKIASTTKQVQSAEKSKPQKTKPQKTIPPKTKTPTKVPAAPSSVTPAKLAPTTVTATPPPGKAMKPIDSYFNKSGGPVPVASLQPPQSQQQDEQKSKEGVVEVISVD
ncbi:unnamed protein product [Phytophthora fragariaefolia]|uniref:Unnamed protein product n=1 Tax=Phytophthora fragariaefolia TaxID=1490495 RepID=A0A9W7D062_9STRA|nr:unnamed protein product [Phytophthora fragariaefolia]